MTTMKKGFIVIIALAALVWIATVVVTKRWREGGEVKSPPSPDVASAAKPQGKAMGLSAPTEAQPGAAKAKEAAKPAVPPLAKPPATPVAQAAPPAQPSAAQAPPAASPAAKPASAPPAEPAPKESLQELKAMADKGGVDKEKAWAILTRKILTAPSETERAEVKKLLDEVTQDLMFSKTPTSFAEIYEVQRGDNLISIARRHQSTLGLIRWANQKSSDRILPGERLKIPTGKVKLMVQKGSLRLIVLFNNNYAKEYPVAIGKSDKTPTGTFIIDDKVVNPDWYAPDGKVYKFGAPENILGSRWLRFKETAQFHGYGIHGTSDPSSIGKPASAGCVRMLNQDVDDLCDVLPLGTEVAIMD